MQAYAQHWITLNAARFNGISPWLKQVERLRQELNGTTSLQVPFNVAMIEKATPHDKSRRSVTDCQHGALSGTASRPIGGD